MNVGESQRIDVATGGDLKTSLRAALLSLSSPGAIYDTKVAHDDDCPMADGSWDTVCTCEIVWLLVRRVA